MSKQMRVVTRFGSLAILVVSALLHASLIFPGVGAARLDEQGVAHISGTWLVQEDEGLIRNSNVEEKQLLSGPVYMLRGNSPEENTVDVIRVSKGGRVTKILESTEHFGHSVGYTFAVSKDERYLVGAVGYKNLVLLDTQTGETRLLLTENDLLHIYKTGYGYGGVSFSPDGTKIVVSVVGGLQALLWVIDIESGHKEILTAHVSQHHAMRLHLNPVWLPTGKIAFSEVDRIFEIDPSDLSFVELPHGRYEIEFILGLFSWGAPYENGALGILARTYDTTNSGFRSQDVFSIWLEDGTYTYPAFRETVGQVLRSATSTPDGREAIRVKEIRFATIATSPEELSSILATDGDIFIGNPRDNLWAEIHLSYDYNFGIELVEDVEYVVVP